MFDRWNQYGLTPSPRTRQIPKGPSDFPCTLALSYPQTKFQIIARLAKAPRDVGHIFQFYVCFPYLLSSWEVSNGACNTKTVFGCSWGKRKEKKREGKKRGKFCSLIMCMFGNKEEKRIISFVWFVKRKEIYVGKFYIVLHFYFYRFTSQ